MNRKLVVETFKRWLREKLLPYMAEVDFIGIDGDSKQNLIVLNFSRRYKKQIKQVMYTMGNSEPKIWEDYVPTQENLAFVYVTLGQYEFDTITDFLLDTANKADKVQAGENFFELIWDNQ